MVNSNSTVYSIFHGFLSRITPRRNRRRSRPVESSMKSGFGGGGGDPVRSWKRRELPVLILYAILFYVVVIRRSLGLSRDYYGYLGGLQRGWLAGRLNDVSDAQWRNFRGNLPILTVVFAIFATVADRLRACFRLRGRGMWKIWLFISGIYLLYLHGACILFIFSIAILNFFIVKIFALTNYFSLIVWMFNIFFLVSNRVYDGYSFSTFGKSWAFLDSYRGTFRWQICFNFVVLRMISFAYDYRWSCQGSRFDHKKHTEGCRTCKSGKTCYLLLQEISVQKDSYSLGMYLCYLLYAPLYIAGPIISFNAFTSQLDVPQKNYSLKEIGVYGARWMLSLFLMELMTHYCYYNAFANSGLWRQLSPMDVFVIGYGVLNFMWLKFLLIWRYFRLWSLICGIETVENMPKCINNCYNLESFWKNWHASYNKWLVRYMYIPLGGARRKLLIIWVVFTFVALWHDLEWKLLSWAWLTCLFYVPELVLKSVAGAFQAQSNIGQLAFREVNALAGAITITCLMVANLVGFVVGPSGLNWLTSRFLGEEGFPTLVGMLASFYVGTKLMFHIQEAKR
ncbi:hypothetical protein MLD38_013681 [Melastoma candidum]|uniref:Uncharacterized protein n=1 Tax=Melastoma candidum TaxID=119954 RepID=A0ACB9RDG5_9MYRT|nr:hypothetical protein MLD38_013681 [Melastoma candidum]